MTSAWERRDSNDLMEMKLRPMVALSIFLHLAVFAIILFVPEQIPAGSFEGVVYEVNLVDMPAAGDLKVKGTSPAREEKGKAIAKRDTQARRIKTVKKEEKPVVLSKRTIKKKTSPKKKPKVSPSQLIDRAISRVERKVKSEEKTHIDKAISELEGKVSHRRGSGLIGGQAAGGISIQIYQAEVEGWIKSNWSYPVALQSMKDLEAVVVILVKRDGTILKTDIKRRSSNRIFDQSVMKAIERSDPLPPFPEGYRKSNEEIEISFNLKDLEDR